MFMIMHFRLRPVRERATARVINSSRAVDWPEDEGVKNAFGCRGFTPESMDIRFDAQQLRVLPVILIGRVGDEINLFMDFES